MSSDQEMEKQFIKDSEQFATVKDKSKWPYDLLGDMYGSYKQATVGDNTASEPYRVQWKLHGQWESSNKFKGVSKKEAKMKYIEFAQQAKSKNLM